MLFLAPLLASLLWAWVAPCASTDLQSIRCPGGAHLREAAPPADANRPEFPSRKLTLEGWVWLPPQQVTLHARRQSEEASQAETARTWRRSSSAYSCGEFVSSRISRSMQAPG